MALDPKLLRQQQRQMKSGQKFLQVGDGKTRVRLLELPSAPGTYFQPVAKHWVEFVNPETRQKENASVFCPKAPPFFKQNCPICDLQSAAYKVDEEGAKRIRANYRGYAPVLNLDDLKSGVQMADLPKSVTDKIFDQVEEGWDLTGEEEGHSVTITSTGEGKGKRYGVTVSPKPVPLSLLVSKMQDVKSVKALIATIPNPVDNIDSENADSIKDFIKKVLKWRPEYKSIVGSAKKSLAALEAPDDDEVIDAEVVDDEDLPEDFGSAKKKPKPVDDEDEEPKCFGKKYDEDDDECEECEHRKSCRKNTEAASKKKSKPKPVDDDDEDDDDDEEEAKPKKQGKPKRGSKPKPVDDDDEDDDYDEEEAKPKKDKKGKKSKGDDDDDDLEAQLAQLLGD